MRGGQGGRGKAVVAGVRARVVAGVRKRTLQAFVRENVHPEATLYTDKLRSYRGTVANHETVNHSAREYVNGMASTNGIESFRSMLKRASDGTCHKITHKHLQRYVDEFTARHNMRSMDTADQMVRLAACMAGKRLTYRELVSG